MKALYPSHGDSRRRGSCVNDYGGSDEMWCYEANNRLKQRIAQRDIFATYCKLKRQSDE